MAKPIRATYKNIKKMKINLTTTINEERQTVEAEIVGVNVYVETAFGRSVIQLKDKTELAAIEPYQEVIQTMADSYAAAKATANAETPTITE